MTDKEIDAMEAGREMDALIAEYVFKLDATCWVHGCEITAHRIASYSTDIAAAWLVVEKLRELNYTHLDLRFHEGRWGMVGYYNLSNNEDFRTTTWADTAPLAICRAALKCCKAVADKKEDALKASVNS